MTPRTKAVIRAAVRAKLDAEIRARALHDMKVAAEAKRIVRKR